MNIEKAKFFDEQVDSDWSSPEYTPEERTKIDRMLEVSGIRTGMSVLEPGCGTGRLTRILSEAVGPSGTVTALDISSKMIDVCKAALGSAPNVSIARAALEDYPFQGKRFDLIICHQVFPHFDDKPCALRTMRGLAAPGGKLMVFHLKGSEFINDLHRKIHPAVTHDAMPSEDEQRRMFSEAGFRIGVFTDEAEGYLLEAWSVG
jgi:demethylmenaquinone methyltransferase/2-methoxy-6-polyprenyl-1,4-benzoquinol methylase